MTTLVKVAVFIDRGEAIRAGHAEWDWQTTELDLASLDQDLREALAQCETEHGALRITHCSSAPDSSDSLSKPRFLWDSYADFEFEREGMPPLVEATPASALQMLKQLVLVPDRLRAMGANLHKEAESRAAERGTKAMEQALSHLAKLDRWLSTPPEELVYERPDVGVYPSRFQGIEPPSAPPLRDIEDHQIAYDLGYAAYLLDGRRYPYGDHRPGSPDVWGSSSYELPYSPPEHIAPADKALREGLDSRLRAVQGHRHAIAAAAVKRFHDWDRARQAQIEEDRRKAALRDALARKAYEAAASNRALKEWAMKGGRAELLELLEKDAPAQLITETLRSIVFEMLSSFGGFKRITKQDLLTANPNLEDQAASLKADFAETETHFPDPQHSAVAQAIMQIVWQAEIPVEFERRLHRGRLIRRGEPIGVAVEGRSLLVTVSFGDLTISKAFAIGIVAPAD